MDHINILGLKISVKDGTIHIYKCLNDLFFEKLFEFLINTKDVKIRILKIHGQDIGLGNNHIFKALCNYLNNVQTLHTLDLSNNSLRNIDLVTLFTILSHNKCKITSLNLSRNSLDNVRMRNIKFINFTKLKRLNLSLNLIGDLGLQYISEALKGNNILKHLDLRNNYYTNNGTVFLSNSLNKNLTLEEFICSEPFLHDASIKDKLSRNRFINNTLEDLCMKAIKKHKHKDTIISSIPRCIMIKYIYT